ncbi:MAG: hypothetical protein QNK70_05605 [Crocinitomicaceae bacterium]
MKIALILFFSLLGVSISAQIKKKDLGLYAGVIEEYRINNGVKLLTVQESTVRVSIDKSMLILQIGQQEYKATYKARKESKRVYKITADLKYSDIQESFYLYGKEKRLLRKGIFPQPDSELVKQSKQEVL